MYCVYLRNNLRLENNELLDLFNNKDLIILIITDQHQLKTYKDNENYLSDKAANFFIDNIAKLKAYYPQYNILVVNRPHNTNFFDLFYNIIKENKIQKIAYFNYYSQYALQRDQQLEKACKSVNCELVSLDESIFSIDKTYFSFSSYHKKTLELLQPTVNTESLIARSKYFNFELPSESLINDYKSNSYISYRTSQISRFLKIGILSNKELYCYVNSMIGIDSKQKLAFSRQLIWKQYYLNLQKHYKWNPSHIMQILPSAYQNIVWVNNQYFAKQLWSGNSGFPILDCIAKKLQETGYINNISRLLIADFSIKILKHNPFEPKWGAMNVFSRSLVDCCSSSNTGNFLWVIGFLDFSARRFTKKDKIPARIFNPCLLAKYDPDLTTIRQYVHELKELSDQQIFEWHKNYRSLIKKYGLTEYGMDYKPIVSFQLEKQIWISKFSK